MFKKTLLLLLFIAQFSIANNECQNALSRLPQINGATHETKSAYGKTYRIYEGVTASALKTSDDYEHFIKNTIEVIFEPAEPFGHIRFRAGDQIYSFNYVRSTSMGGYSPRARKGHFGFAYYVDSQKIAQLKDEMAQFYGHSRSFNFPPFDAYSPPLKIIKDGDRYRYVSPSPDHANNSAFNAQIINEDGAYYLSKDGYKFPVKKIGDDEFEIQSYSCISSTDYWARRFGVNLEPRYSAKTLKDVLLDTNHGLSQPDIILKYAN